MAEFFSNYSGAQPQRTSLADMMNMASGVQNYQQAQQMNPLALRKAAAETMVSEQTAPTRIAQQQAETETAQAGANSAKLKNILDHVSNIKRESVKLLSEKSLTREDVIKHYKDTLESAGGDEKALAQAIRKIPQTNDTNELKKWIARDFTGALTAESQIEKLFPAAQMVDTGTEKIPTYMGSALSFNVPGTKAGPGIESQLPPGTQVVNPQTGATQLLGPASQRQPTQSLQTGVGPAQANLLTGVGENISKDYTNTVFEAQGAPGRIAVFQNIKKLVPESFTGVGGERKQFLSGLAQAVGIPANVLETSSTDELAKNTKLLQLAGGNTDAARGIAELANPNTKMTKEGILRVTDQLIGMEKMKEAKAKYLQPYSQNAAKYQEEMNKFSQISDPRLFQEMSQSEAKKLWDSMSDAEKAAMIRIQKQAKQMGVIK